MRLNFTGRRKIDKQHVRIALHDDPVASKRGYYFEMIFSPEGNKFPPDAGVFVEATCGPTLMRFDYGLIADQPNTSLSIDQRRLKDFPDDPSGIKFRIKVTQLTGTETGKLLAEADGVRPEDEGVIPLIHLAGDSEMGQTPWRLELVPTDHDLPTLFMHTDLGGKEYAKDPVAKPLLMTAAAREVFSALVSVDIEENDEGHWSSLWARFATQVLGMSNPTQADSWTDDEKRMWIDKAVNEFSAIHELAGGLKSYKNEVDLQEQGEIV